MNIHTFVTRQSWEIFILYAKLLVLLNYGIDSNPLLSQATCHDITTLKPPKINPDAKIKCEKPP